MGYDHGLKQVGEVFHYRFKHCGQVLRGSTSCRTLSDAQKWLRRYQANLALEGVGIRQAPSLAGLLQEWEKVAAATNASAELDRMRSSVTKHLKPLLSMPIDQLMTDKVQACLVTYLETKGDGTGRKGHSPGGANALLLRLNTLIGWAIRCGYLAKKPYEVKRFKRQQEPRPVVRTCKTQDFFATLERIGRSKDRKMAICLMLGLGLRESEALGLRWEFLDLPRGSIVVGRIEDERFKTKGGEARQLPIPSWLLAMLKERWESSKKPTAGLVLPGPKNPGTKLSDPHSPGYTAPLVRRVGTELGLVGLSPHRLRASFISALALEANVPLPQVQKMAGHKHLVTTMRYVEGAEEHTDALATLEILQGFGKSGVPKKEIKNQKPARKKSKKDS